MSDLVAFSGELYLLSAVSIVPIILLTCLSGTYILSLPLVIDMKEWLQSVLWHFLGVANVFILRQFLVRRVLL